MKKEISELVQLYSNSGVPDAEKTYNILLSIGNYIKSNPNKLNTSVNYLLMNVNNDEKTDIENFCSKVENITDFKKLLDKPSAFSKNEHKKNVQDFLRQHFKILNILIYLLSKHMYNEKEYNIKLIEFWGSAQVTMLNYVLQANAHFWWPYDLIDKNGNVNPNGIIYENKWEVLFNYVFNFYPNNIVNEDVQILHARVKDILNEKNNPSFKDLVTNPFYSYIHTKTLYRPILGEYKLPENYKETFMQKLGSKGGTLKSYKKTDEKIYILKRDRCLYISGRAKYIKYQNAYISLKDARKLDKQS